MRCGGGVVEAFRTVRGGQGGDRHMRFGGGGGGRRHVRWVGGWVGGRHIRWVCVALEVPGGGGGQALFDLSDPAAPAPPNPWTLTPDPWPLNPEPWTPSNP